MQVVLIDGKVEKASTMTRIRTLMKGQDFYLEEFKLKNGNYATLAINRSVPKETSKEIVKILLQNVKKVDLGQFPYSVERGGKKAEVEWLGVTLGDSMYRLGA